jgi:hypothetical protein
MTTSNDISTVRVYSTAVRWKSADSSKLYGTPILKGRRIRQTRSQHDAGRKQNVVYCLVYSSTLMMEVYAYKTWADFQQTIWS